MARSGKKRYTQAEINAFREKIKMAAEDMEKEIGRPMSMRARWLYYRQIRRKAGLNEEEFDASFFDAK